MLFQRATFIGVDPTAGQRPFVYAALDHQLQLLALARGDMDEVLAFLGGQEQAFVGICAPQRPNQGLMADPTVRSQLAPPPRAGRFSDYRLAEYILRQHQIPIYRTPAKRQACPRWIQVGFAVYERLATLGYQAFPAGESQRQFLEVYPHASFCAWLKKSPFPKNTLEGRIQRQLVLYELGLKMPDPMRFFEEITRHRLMQGLLPEDILCSSTELDALAAALTAWTAAVRPAQTTRIGDFHEGQIVLPIPSLRSKY